VARDDHGMHRPTCPACGYIHYRNPVPAAGVLLEWRGGLLLVRRRFDPRAGAWCLPSGFMEYGETPERCALRELREETGIAGALGELFGVYAGRDDPRVRAVLVLYTATRAGGRLTAGDDAIEARFFPFDALPRPIAFEAHGRALADYARRRAPAGGGGEGKRRSRRRAWRPRWRRSTARSEAGPALTSRRCAPPGLFLAALALRARRTRAE
jgi:ADP-ribose pyrophosphatase YjhB (NUDIX family)